MPELLTMQDLANGHLDVKALGEAANGDENTIVTTRTGNTYPSAERAINIMFQNGGLPAKPFSTLAKMQTDGASLAENALAFVYGELVNNGLYEKKAGVWVKAPYDPVGASKSYADSNPLFKPVALTTAQDVLGLNEGIYHIASNAIAETLIGMPPDSKAGTLKVTGTGAYKSIDYQPYGRNAEFYINQTYNIGEWQGWLKYSSDGVLDSKYATNDYVMAAAAALLNNISQTNYFGMQFSDPEMSGTKLYNEGYYIGFNAQTAAAISFNSVEARIFNTDNVGVEYRVYTGDAVASRSLGFYVLTGKVDDYSFSGICKSFPSSDNGAAQTILLDKAISLPPGTPFIIVFKSPNTVKFSVAAHAAVSGNLESRSFNLVATSSNWASLTTIGNASLSYIQAGFKLLISLSKQGAAETSKKYTPTLVMPPNIYVLANLQAHIYPEHLLPESSDLYLHDVTCSRGKQTERGWVYDVPTTQAAGNISLTWTLADRQTGATLNTATTTLVVADQTKSGTKNVIVIGDSYVNAGAITQRLLDISATDALKTTLIGTRGADVNKHEGRGGWKVSDYATAGRTYYQFTVSGVTTVPAINSTVYTFGGGTFVVQEIAISAGAGTITCSFSSGTAPTNGSTGTLTKSSGAGDATIVFSNVQSLSGNPFWFSGAINFGQYLSTNSLSTPDVALIQLGVNDSFGATTDADVEAIAATAFAQIDTLITSIKASNAAVKIGIISPPAYANQDGFGYDYGCGQTAWRAKRNIVAWNKKLYAYFAGKAAQNVYVVAAGLNVDTENNFPTITQAINSQNANMITVQKGGVHPAESGYKQIGDAMFAFIKAIS